MECKKTSRAYASYELTLDVFPLIFQEINARLTKNGQLNKKFTLPAFIAACTVMYLGGVITKEYKLNMQVN